MDCKGRFERKIGTRILQNYVFTLYKYKELLEKRRKKARSEKLASVIISKFLSGFSTRRIAKEV